MRFMVLNGHRVPALGFGTFELRGEVCRNAVRVALRAGYRHLDTARAYGNESEVGAAIRESGVPRDEIFLTTKVWFRDLSASGVERQVSESLRDLGTEYADLVLVHWPNDDYPLGETITALERERERGRTRLVGVSNFTPSLVEQARKHAAVCCNQVEYHPLLDQSRLLDQARRHGMMLTAYSPLAQGKALAAAAVIEIARRLDRDPAQILLRWLLQQDRVAAIPRSSRPAHIRTNLRIFDFELDASAVEVLSGLGTRDGRIIDPEWAPAWGS